MIHFIVYASEHPDQFEWLAELILIMADVSFTLFVIWFTWRMYKLARRKNESLHR